MRVVSLCNRSEFLKEETKLPVKDRSASSDGSEIALMKYAHIYFFDSIEYRKKNKKIAEIPFNSKNKYQVFSYYR